MKTVLLLMFLSLLSAAVCGQTETVSGSQLYEVYTSASAKFAVAPVRRSVLTAERFAGGKLDGVTIISREFSGDRVHVRETERKGLSTSTPTIEIRESLRMGEKTYRRENGNWVLVTKPEPLTVTDDIRFSVKEGIGAENVVLDGMALKKYWKRQTYRTEADDAGESRYTLHEFYVDAKGRVVRDIWEAGSTDGAGPETRQTTIFIHEPKDVWILEPLK